MSGRFFAFLLLALAALSAAAQTTAGQITGLVSDPSGALITGAAVVARNSATGVTWQTASNDAGNYAIPSPEPGIYSVTVQREGLLRRSAAPLR
jgi:hypothetical protein